MKKAWGTAGVTLVMIVAILGITNPGRKMYGMFDRVEGRMEHNYFLFSIYRQYGGFTLSADGKYRLYKRYIGICMQLYEISPLKVAVADSAK
ncbi:MAG TPA: hypothetical protein VG842_00715 [Sediminibacterium sp.]|nr:hypothetical protein [Sediminibacterium sp.]